MQLTIICYVFFFLMKKAFTGKACNAGSSEFRVCAVQSERSISALAT